MLKPFLQLLNFGRFYQILKQTGNPSFNLGGGVITDLGGFVARPIKRGINF